MYDQVRLGNAHVGDDFVKSCIIYDQLEYVNAFEEVIYELIYRRERHKNQCAVFYAQKNFEQVYTAFYENQETALTREGVNNKLRTLKNLITRNAKKFRDSMFIKEQEEREKDEK